MSGSISELIDEIIRVEGGYTDDPTDAGGKTKFGITEKTARANGYTGDMRDLPIEFAKDVYYKQYVIAPGFEKVAKIAGEQIAHELVDTGVNCGQPTAAKMLQRCLNALNNVGTLFPNLVEDGDLGQKSFDALAKFIQLRGNEGAQVLFVALNGLQVAHYVGIAANNEKQEKYVYGWLKNRVSDQLK